MNNKFILNANGIKKEAEMIVKFNLENKDYLIYCTDENESNKQVFVSKLTLNSEGKYFIDDITSEEKNKLSGVVYNIVILTPNEAKKGVEAKTLIDKLTNENKVMLSVEMPILNEQSYYSNCSIAITSKLLVEEAINFFKTNLTSKVEEPVQSVPTWSIPTMEPSVTPQNVPTTEIPSVPITNIPTMNEPSVSTEQVPVNNNAQLTPEQPISAEQTFNATPTPVQIPNETVVASNNSGMVNEPNPQAEKLAVVSDPSLNSAGLNLQPNVARRNSAGNANTKYIIIGTICLVLAIAVVVVAYFLIKNMK